MSSVKIDKDTGELVRKLTGAAEPNLTESELIPGTSLAIWDVIKRLGSDHYKAETEPIDLMKAGGMMHDKAVADIIKYAYRNRRELRRPVERRDIVKIIHYALILAALDRINPWALIEEIDSALKGFPIDAADAADPAE